MELGIYRVYRKGLRGLMINIPAAYRDQFNIKPGDEMRLSVKENKLIVERCRDGKTS